MWILRFASTLALALWVGGLSTLALAAPQLLVPRFRSWFWMLGSALILLLIARKLIGPPPQQFYLRVWIVSATVAVSIAANRLQNFSNAVVLIALAAGIGLIYAEVRDGA